MPALKARDPHDCGDRSLRPFGFAGGDAGSSVTGVMIWCARSPGRPARMSSPGGWRGVGGRRRVVQEQANLVGSARMIYFGENHVGPGERDQALLAGEREVDYQGLLGVAGTGGGRCDHRSSSADDLGSVLIAQSRDI